MAQGKDAIYGTEKLAKFFGVAEKTARAWCQRGKLPAFKIGHEWKVRAEDLKKMIDRKVQARREEKNLRLF